MIEFEQFDDYIHFNDVELIDLYNQGDQLAFQQLVVRYIFIIRNKSLDLYNMGIEPEDLFQEGLIGLHNAVRSFNKNDRASFRTYAGICIRNRLVSAVRTANTDKNKINNISDNIYDETEIQSLPFTEPENALIIKESFQGFIDYLKTNFSETELSVLSLYLEGNSYDMIAEQLKLTKKACDNAMQRIRKKLRIMN